MDTAILPEKNLKNFSLLFQGVRNGKVNPVMREEILAEGEEKRPKRRSHFTAESVKQ